ncbi:uncharacterized protein LOC117168286 [Belonocnema kinseyi]|uniref:uncharacterized protein LOC117168286 n=1 Tax=Belonocnema kinseyi TaxID=2817044 RepID=UPI00143D0A85|nr:uncharacterized protein LOC117168286 [Belonocnema kinseyi]
MKIFSIILLAALITFQAESADVEENLTEDLNEVSTRLDLNGNLKAFLEKLKETLKTGDESKGIPILDPLASPEIGPLSVDWEDLVGTLFVQSVGLSGLSEYIVQNATKISLVKLKVDISLRWPEIQGNLTGYDINSRLMDFVNVVGQGFAEFSIKDFNFDIKTTTTKSKETGKLHMDILGLDFSMGDFKIRLEGLYGDEMISEIFSGIVSDLVPEAIETYKDLMLSAIKKFTSDAVNQIIGDMAISDIIGIINGKKNAKSISSRISNVDWNHNENLLKQIIGVFNHKN